VTLYRSPRQQYEQFSKISSKAAEDVKNRAKQSPPNLSTIGVDKK